MVLNSRSKGQTGERELATRFNSICLFLGLPHDSFQRNQNQSAIGGSDLTNPYGLSIEVKRCETVLVNQWWEQCTTQALKERGMPILIYRKNRSSWVVVMNTLIPVPLADYYEVRSEISYKEFEHWLKIHLTSFVK